MAAPLETISRDTLWKRIQQEDQLVLVDALPPMSFAASHLPGAISMPPAYVEKIASRRIPDLDSSVVVYCAGPDCDSSIIVAQRLIELGYRSVVHYADGKNAWAEAGLPLEGGRA